jgi:two-component system sensor histidine kinase PilS (NtrC family)
VVLDVAVAGALVAVTGRSDSIFVFLFSLAVVNGGILLYRRGAVVAALLAVSLYLAVALSGGAHPEGTRLFVHAAAFAATAALASYLAEQLRSASERLTAREGEIADITALHESIVQSLESGLLTLDKHGRATFLNRAGERLTGLELESLRGRADTLWFEPLARTPRGETDWVNARGERLRIGYTSFPLRGREGREIGYAVIFQDLTPFRAMEEQVRRSERLADLGRLAAGLAHELRNPLAAMTGSVELLRDAAREDGDAQRLMDILLREASRLNRLVSRFLQFTRPAPPQRAVTDLGLLVAETLGVFVNDPAAVGVAVEKDLVPTPIACDPDQMKEVLWNLLVNAAQAIGVRERRGGCIRIACRPDSTGGAIVSVEDDGPGIAEGDLRKIFLPFHTTKEQGTGLGLATVQRVVDAHGGTVEVFSVPGRGARFTVRLPAATTRAPELNAEGPEVLPELHRSSTGSR